MSPPEALRAVAVDDQGAITEDVPCCRCGYNLRGLRPEGLCPECAAPIATSLRDERLSLADAKWTRRLAAGARLAFAGVLLVTVLQMVESSFWQQLAVGWQWLAYGVAGLAQLAGVWLLTVRDPLRLVVLKPGRLGALRIALIAGLACDALSHPLFGTRGYAEPPEACWYVGRGLVFVVGGFALMLVLERFARRIPHVGMAQWTRVLRWTCAGSEVALTGAWVACWGWGYLHGSPAFGTADLERHGLLSLWNLAEHVAFAASLAWLVLLWKLGRAFAAQARAGRSFRPNSSRGPAAG